MTISLLLTLTLSLPVVAAEEKKEPPAKMELFAGEDWYKKQEGKETEFVGVLKKIDRGGRIGFGRMNPYRLEMKGDSREVYVGGKRDILNAYVGKTIKLTGKAVDIGVEGKKYREIWPARVEIVPEKKQGRLSQGLPSLIVAESKPDASKELKILARAPWRASARPNSAAQQLVIRSGAELAAASGQPRTEQGIKQATEMLARLLKVKEIDWNKQMIVVTTAGAKPTGGYSVEVTGLTIKDGTLTVKWKLNSPGPNDFVTQAFTHPGQAVLVEKFDGKVTFDPPAPRGRDDK